MDVRARGCLSTPSSAFEAPFNVAPSRAVALSRALLVSLAVALPSAAQVVFVEASASIPQTGSFTENVDFADVDADGDWDAALADGGDLGNDQNRLWLNQGGAQGGVLGMFSDVTAARMPLVSDDSRDVEFADIDADGDLDLFVSNTSHFQNQTNRWLANVGGAQGGQLGSYVDETATRWIGLGGPGSSLPAPAVLASGGFIDWSCDSDFADLDDDGDLDLVQSSYGATFGGTTPTRLYTNDGAGQYVEFNPSGYQLSTTLLQGGEPGLWCEGVYAPNTGDASGQQCDIATSGLDVDPLDVDLDYDLDLALCARQEAPRVFANRYVESAGALGFRDVTGALYPPGAWSGGDNMAQEFADWDGDLDLDLLGVNWPGSNEVALSMQSNGLYAIAALLPSSSNTDAEGDAADFDGDGDLDVYMAGFFGANRMYANTGAGSPAFTYAAASGAGAAGDRSLDADVADVDGDGDYDVLCAEDAGLSERLRTNILDVPDTRAPRFAGVEALPSMTAAALARSVHAAILGDGSVYTTWYDAVELRVEVQGCPLPPIEARSSRGQIFRAELPGNLLGAVEYRFRATDEHGNSALSAPRTTSGSLVPSPFASFGNGSAGPLGVPVLALLSAPFAGSTFHLAFKGVSAASPVLVYLASAALPLPLQLPGVCELDIAGSVLAAKAGSTDAAGCLVWALPLPAGVPSGASAFAQGFAPGQGTAGNFFAASRGYSIQVP
jgi:hypothetical protein